MMSCDVAALPFLAHANYGTWLIEFSVMIIRFILLKRNNPYNINIKSNKF